MRDHTCPIDAFVPRASHDPTDPPVIMVCPCGRVMLDAHDPRIALAAPVVGPVVRADTAS